MIKNFLKGRKKKLNGELVYEINLKNSPIGVALAEIKISKEHFHKKMIEWYYIIQGRAEIYLDRKRLILRKNDFIKIPPNSKHFIKKIGRKNVKILVITLPPWNKKDYYLV